MPGSVWHGSDALWAALEMEMHEGMRVKLKLNGDPKKPEMPRLWDVYQEKPQAARKVSPREKPCGRQDLSGGAAQTLGGLYHTTM